MNQETYTDALARFSQGPVFEGNNPFLMTLACKARGTGRTKEEAKVEIWGAYMAQLSGRGEAFGTREAEVDRAVGKAFSGEPAAPPPRKTAEDTDVGVRERIAKWRRGLGDHRPAIEDEISDDHRERPEEVLGALFRNVGDPLVWASASMTDAPNPRQFHRRDGFSGIPKSDRYICVSSFRKPTERTNANVDKVALVLLEIDAELATGRKADDPYSTHLRDTCLVLEAAGLRPTTITWSGSKSYHCLFRLKEPVSFAEFEARKTELKEALKGVGMDGAVATASRGTRRPKPVSGSEQDPRDYQHLVFIDPESEIGFCEYVDALVRLAGEIHGGAAKCPCPVVRNDKTGRWSEDALGVSRLIDHCGLGIADGRLVQVDDRLVYREVKPHDAMEAMVEEVARDHGEEAAAQFSKIASAALCQHSLARYAGHSVELRPWRDGDGEIIVPFRNAVIRIRRDGVEAKPYDGVHHTPALAPTLSRDWLGDDGQISEFQQFVERAAGKAEGHPRWKERAKSYMTLLGYLASRRKEVVNYICVLFDEGLDENEGGTGKSLLLQAAAKFRTDWYRGMKSYTDQAKRFFFADLTPDYDFIFLDDVQREFDFEWLFNLSTTGGAFERKGESKYVRIALEDTPKIAMTTNFFPRGLGRSFARRTRFFEIGGHYRAFSNGVHDEFHHQFFRDWDAAEWGRFDVFMAKCAMLYLRDGLVESRGEDFDERVVDANISAELQAYFLTVADRESWDPDELSGGYEQFYQDNYHRRSARPIQQKTMMRLFRQFQEARGVTLTRKSVRKGKAGAVVNWYFRCNNSDGETLQNVTQIVTSKNTDVQSVVDSVTIVTHKNSTYRGVVCNQRNDDIIVEGNSETNRYSVTPFTNHSEATGFDVTHKVTHKCGTVSERLRFGGNEVSGRNNTTKPMNCSSDNPQHDDRMDFDLSNLPGHMLEWRRPSKGSVVDPATNLPMTPDGLVDGLGHFKPSPLDETGARPVDPKLMEFLDGIGYGPRWKYIPPAE